LVPCVVVPAWDPPTGARRLPPALAEFAGDLPIVMVNPAGEREEITLAELFPAPFRLAPR